MSMMVFRDVNDNPPVLPVISPITIQAGTTRRRIINLNATDLGQPTTSLEIASTMVGGGEGVE